MLFRLTMTTFNFRQKALIELAVEDYKETLKPGVSNAKYGEKCKNAIGICDEILAILKA